MNESKEVFSLDCYERQQQKHKNDIIDKAKIFALKHVTVFDDV